MKRISHNHLILAAAILGITLVAWAQPRARISQADLDNYYQTAGGQFQYDGDRLPPPPGDGDGDFESPPFPPRFGDRDGFRPPSPPPPGPGGHLAGIIHRLQQFCHFWENEELVEKMQLTETQIADLEASYQATKDALEATSGTLRAAGEALRDSVEEPDTPDLNEVNQNIDQFTEALNEKMRILLAHRVVVNTVLTQEQEDILREDRCNRRPGRPGMGERLHLFKGLIRELAADGELSEEDWALINEKIAPLPEEFQERIRERIQQHLENPDSRPSGPGNGFQREGQFRGRRNAR